MSGWNFFAYQSPVIIFLSEIFSNQRLQKNFLGIRILNEYFFDFRLPLSKDSG